MIITQTVDIPANRRLMIDVPPEIPVGEAEITFRTTGLKKPALANIHGRRISGLAKELIWMVDDFDAHAEELNREAADALLYQVDTFDGIAMKHVKKNTLAEMLDQITEQNIHREIKTGEPVGKEIW